MNVKISTQAKEQLAKIINDTHPATMMDIPTAIRQAQAKVKEACSLGGVEVKLVNAIAKFEHTMQGQDKIITKIYLHTDK